MEALGRIVKGVDSFNRYKRREEKAERKSAFEKADIIEDGYERKRDRRKSKKGRKEKKSRSK